MNESGNEIYKPKGLIKGNVYNHTHTNKLNCE